MAARAQKLTTFAWEGTDKSGRRIKGEHQAPSLAFVNAVLRRQGIRPIKVRKQGKPLFSLKNRKVQPKDIAIASRQLATMIGAGVPIAQSFEILGRGHDNPSMKALLISIRQDVEAGTNLSTALGRHPLHFDELYQSLVSAGEQSGTLDTIMNKIAAYKEKVEKLKGQIKSALFYPAVVIVVAFVVTAILLLFVIPQFEALFNNFGAELPSLTKFVVELSRSFQKNWWIIIGTAVVGITVLVFTYKRSQKMQRAMDRLVLRLPIIGVIMRKATIARFSRTLATMFGAGVPLVDSLDSVAGAAGNRVYYEGILRIKNEVSTGQQLATAMSSTNLFPNMVVQMVAIGEESGELETMLTKVADFFEAEVDDAVAALSSLIEPIIIVVLGVIIGGMVVAMYMPIFKMAAVF